MQDQMSRLKELQSRLSSLPIERDSVSPGSSKPKIKTLQNMIARLVHQYEEQGTQEELKINQYIDHLRKIQIITNEHQQKLELKEHNAKTRISKIDKTLKKTIQKQVKERREVDKKIQSGIQNYLIQLTGLKGKTQSGCQSSIRELQSLEAEVSNTSKQIENQSMTSRQISKKVYAQFSIQIEEISDQIQQQKRQRQQEQDNLISTLQLIYANIHQSILDIKRARQKNDRQIVDLLERVIEKVRMQLTRN